MAKYIDAKYLFKCNTCTHCRNGRCREWCDHYECYTPDLNLIPAADVVEVRHGEWETKEVLSEPGEVQKYSHFHKECKYFYVDYGIGGHYYCPLCGAKMDGKDGAE